MRREGAFGYARSSMERSAAAPAGVRNIRREKARVLASRAARRLATTYEIILPGSEFDVKSVTRQKVFQEVQQCLRTQVSASDLTC